MALLARNSTPAERRRYCSFAEKFERADLVRANAGYVSDPMLIDNGATFDGVSDVINYGLDGDAFRGGEISMVAEFAPNFAANSGTDHLLLFAYDPGKGGAIPDYAIIKTAANTIEIVMGATTLTAIPLIDFQDYWLTGQRNVIVVSGTSGANNAWLNGIGILEGEATAWSPATPHYLTVGGTGVGLYPYDGIMYSVKVFQSLLDQTEALDYYDYGKPPTPLVLG
jgi:hypothetical protein